MGAAAEGGGDEGAEAGGAACFEVLDALGIATLTKRSPTLDGSVPLRVAQACVPLLEGNAFGLQITLKRPIEIRRRLGGVIAEPVGARAAEVLAAHRAALPRMRAQGLLEAGWARALAEGVAAPAGGRFSSRIRIWTGLLVRPDRGVWLRIAGAANRRNLLVEVEEAFVPDDGAFVPLCVEIALGRGAPDVVRLEGEIACVAPVAPGVAIDEVPLAAAREIGEAHAAFYDARYFATKKGEVTRKYRRMLRAEGRDEERAGEGARCRLVRAGPAAHAVAEVDRFVTSAGPAIGPRRSAEARRLAYVIHRNLVPFEARFDGHTLAIEPDRRALDEGSRAVERAWGEVFGEAFLREHKGALLYLTKYFTPHPPGEPHFFVKPWAFFETPPGWSSLIEGEHGAGWDVLRGVVATDRFFATPAVFWVHRLGASILVPAGEPLVRVLPIPRRLLGAGFRAARWPDEPR